MLVNKQFKLAESTAKRSKGVTTVCAQMTTSGLLRALLPPQDFTHSGHEDVEQAHAKQGPKEHAEKAYLTSLSALFVMARVCWAGGIPAW